MAVDKTSVAVGMTVGFLLALPFQKQIKAAWWKVGTFSVAKIRQTGETITSYPWRANGLRQFAWKKIDSMKT